MADDPNPALRAEWTAALAVLDPEIRGLQALLKFPFPPEIINIIMGVIDDRVRRRNLVQAALVGLDSVVKAELALEADGYPNLGKISVIHTIEQALKEAVLDLEAAVDVFIEGHAEIGDFNPQRSVNA